MQLPKQVSESFKKRNPHLYPLGQVETKVSKPTTAPALARSIQQQSRRKGGVHVIVTLVAFRKRLLDDDNNTGSFKPARDAIAKHLGIDDADPRIKFETEQVITKGEEGVVVKIEYQCL